uniref:Putative secreted protein n=1 Tax=Anopheles darlingi TaxID=43151 RepID=A0A2M4D236_ANODA
MMLAGISAALPNGVAVSVLAAPYTADSDPGAPAVPPCPGKSSPTTPPPTLGAKRVARSCRDASPPSMSCET